MAEWSKAPESKSGPQMWAWVRIPFSTLLLSTKSNLKNYTINSVFSLQMYNAILNRKLYLKVTIKHISLNNNLHLIKV